MRKANMDICKTLEIISHFQQFCREDKLRAVRAIEIDVETRRMVSGLSKKKDLVEVIRWLARELYKELPVQRVVKTDELYEDGRLVQSKSVFMKGIEIKTEGGNPDGMD